MRNFLLGLSSCEYLWFWIKWIHHLTCKDQVFILFSLRVNMFWESQTSYRDWLGNVFRYISKKYTYCARSHGATSGKFHDSFSDHGPQTPKPSSIQQFITLPYRVWSSIVIVHEKSVFFLLFSKYLKNGWNYFD